MTGFNTKKNVAILVGGRTLEKVIGLVALIIYARIFSATDLALVPLVSLLGGLVPIVLCFGIIPTIVMETPRLLVSDRDRAFSLVRRALIIGIAAAVFAGISLVLYGDQLMVWFSPKMAQAPGLILWTAVAVATQSLFAMLNQILSGLVKFWDLTIANLASSATRIAFVLVFFHWYGAAGIAAGIAASMLVGCVYSLWAIRKELSAKISQHYRYGAILKISWPFYLEGYVMYLRSQGDQLVVTSILGAESLAFYYVARRLYDFLRTLSDSIDSAFIPALSKLSLGSRKEFSEWWHRLFRAGFVISVPVAFAAALFVPLYVIGIGADKYQAAMAPAIVLCLAFIVDIMKVMVARSVFVLCPPIKRLQITSLESSVMLPLLVVGALALGTLGVALAYMLSGIVAGWYAYRILHKEIDLSLGIKDWLPILAAALFALALASFLLITAWHYRYAGIIPPGLLSLAGITVFAMAYVNFVSRESLVLALDSMLGSRAPVLRHLLLKLRLRRGLA